MSSILEYNLILDTDSYKANRTKEYHPDTEYVYSYMESRGGVFDEMAWFGWQYIQKRYLEGVQVTNEKIEEAKEDIVGHLGGNPNSFNEAGWRHIVNKHGGMLPVRIRAVPEGTIMNRHNVLVDIVNTDPLCAWLPGHLETPCLRAWYPSSVCTLSREVKKVILEFLELSVPGTAAEHEAKLEFMLHDFGARSGTSRESAMIGAAAHAVNFKGSDTMDAIRMIKRIYNKRETPFYSVPASEHSVMTSWPGGRFGEGRIGEVNAIQNMLDQYPTGIVSIVGDSYNIYYACSELFGTKFRDQIMTRNGVTVIRLDSGEINSTNLKVLEILAEKFGFEVNSKGYKTLPPYIRILQGDGMNIFSVRSLLRAITDAGWSVDNYATLGMGTKLIQDVNRDTGKFAFKCSAISRNGKWYPVFKDPITDQGKTSKPGIHNLQEVGLGQFRTCSRMDMDHVYGDKLVTVFENGVGMSDSTFEEVRERAALRRYDPPSANKSIVMMDQVAARNL